MDQARNQMEQTRTKWNKPETKGTKGTSQEAMEQERNQMEQARNQKRNKPGTKKKQAKNQCNKPGAKWYKLGSQWNTPGTTWNVSDSGVQNVVNKLRIVYGTTQTKPINPLVIQVRNSMEKNYKASDTNSRVRINKKKKISLKVRRTLEYCITYNHLEPARKTHASQRNNPKTGWKSRQQSYPETIFCTSESYFEQMWNSFFYIKTTLEST